MSTLKVLSVISAALALALALGWLTYHYVAFSEQLMRLMMV